MNSTMTDINTQVPDVYNSEVSDEFKTEWDEFIHNTPGGTFFHLYDWLKITAEKTGYQLLPVTVKEKKEITAVAPFFIKKTAGITLCFSPPSKMSTPWAGPVFKHRFDRPNKIHKKTAVIIEEIHKFLVEEIGVDYINITTTPELVDVRPFKWYKYKTLPLYTYMVDIKNPENVYHNFEKKIKREINSTEKNTEVSYKYHDRKYYYLILDEVKKRYKEQGMKFSISDTILKKVLESDLKNYVTTRSVVTDQGLVTGMILITYKNGVHHWMGATKPLQNYSGACSYLHWNTMKEFSKKGMETYELMGGNTRHLIEQKSRFNGDLVTYYNSEWSNGKGRLVKGGMKLRNLYKEKVNK